MSETIDEQQKHHALAEILVVDDVPVNLHFLKFLLKMRGYDVRTAGNGTEALTSIRENLPDLVLLDIMMPDLSGYEVCEQLKADESTRDVPIIFVSAKTETLDKVKAFQLGAVDYLVKPLEREEVLVRVRTHLEIRRLQQQLQEENERFRRIEDVTFDGLLVHENGRILEVNRALMKLSGYQRDEIVGRHVLECIAPSFYDVVKACLEAQDDRTDEPDDRFVEIEGLARDGTSVPLQVRGKTILWKKREARICILQDLSQRKQLEQKARQLELENMSLRATSTVRDHLGELLGESLAMQKLYERILQAATSQETIVIYGETGTGKELAAQTIFQLREHHRKNFVPVNCGAVQETLFESAFFGYRRGAFTGANRDTPGYFEQAEGGTLFLDEVAELRIPMQIKLLRVLNDGTYTPLGAKKSLQADVCIIAATNQELRQLMHDGKVREDFFHRLHVIALEVPPLRSRKEDIPLLMKHFLAQQISVEDSPPEMAPSLFERFMDYDWPGNVRELFNELRRWLNTGDVELAGVTRTVSVDPRDFPFLQDELTLKTAMRAFEQFYVKRALQIHHGHRGHAAKHLGIDRRTLFSKLKKFET